MSEALKELSNALADATRQVSNHVVAVHMGPRGSSSGIIWRPGVIVTADHALHHADEVQVTLPDQHAVAARVAGRDPSTDLAVLKCAEAIAVPEAFGDASALAPGNLVLVVGRTRVSGPVAALGVVSLAVAKREQWSGATLAPYLRLDVGLQQTAIGGAVLDSHGAIIGLATPKFARFGALTIPANTIHRVVDVLLTRGRIPRGYLGVGLQSVRLPADLVSASGRHGKTATIVLDVASTGPAHDAGVLIGDLVLALDGKEVLHPGDIHSLLGPESVGRRLPLRFARAGKIQELQIAVVERPNGEE